MRISGFTLGPLRFLFVAALALLLAQSNACATIAMETQSADPNFGSLLVYADAITDPNALQELGIEAIHIDMGGYLLRGSLGQLTALFYRRLSTSAPVSLLDPLRRIFTNPTAVECVGTAAYVAYASGYDWHAGGGPNGSIKSTSRVEVGAFVEYVPFRWPAPVGNYYSPNWVKDVTNNKYIFNNTYGGELILSGSSYRDLSTAQYLASTQELAFYMNYGQAQIIAMAYAQPLQATATGGEGWAKKTYTIPKSSWVTGECAILGSTPTGVIAEPLSRIVLHFNTDVDPTSFTPDDALLAGPAGTYVPDTVEALDARTVALDFATPLAHEGTYILSVGPAIRTVHGALLDQDADGIGGESPDDIYRAELTIDLTAPASPTVNTYTTSPSINRITRADLVLTGTREAGTAIWIGAREVAAAGSETWTATLTLAEGLNELRIHAKDAAGNGSPALTLLFERDTVTPTVTGITPANTSQINQRPQAITVTYTETGSGLDADRSTVTVTRDGASVRGTLAADATALRFSPHIELVEGTYTVSVRLQDRAGLTTAAFSSSFTLDQTPPVAPTLDPIPAVTSINQQILGGSKEAYAAILVNGSEVIGHTAATTWSYTRPLVNGLNTLTIQARDRAGNTSIATLATIAFDDTAPGPVPVRADGVGDGTRVVLDWRGYDEVANGNDIRHYTVYLHTLDFRTMAEASALATVPAGTRTYTVTGLAHSQTYYAAVVATDTLSNALTTVVPVAVTPIDTMPPAEITDLTVAAFVDRLVLSWTPSTAHDEDLAGYRLYVDGGGGTALAAESTSHTLTGLRPATGYPIRLTAVDQAGNESAGVALTGVTLLPNPTGLVVEPLSGQVALSWNAVDPRQYLGQYAIYAAESDFTSIAGMTPRLRVAPDRTQAQLAGLTNGRTYYLAVTAVSLSGGETDTVTTVATTPTADREGPQLGTPTFNARPVTDGATLDIAGTLAVGTSDPSGVGRVGFRLDDTPLGTDLNGADGYTAAFDPATVADGPHTLTITAHDTLDNVSTLTRTVTVALAPPAAPQILAPASGHITNSAQLAVSGSAAPAASVQLRLDGVAIADPVTVDAGGRFRGSVTLAEGTHTLTATAANRSGVSAPSAPVTVTLDARRPEAPLGLTAEAKAQGQVSLRWYPSLTTPAPTYDLYRAGGPFSDITAAVKVNNRPLMATRFDDLPAADGEYVYRVVAVNELGTTSPPSNEARAVADSIPPRAERIDFSPAGRHDPLTGRIAPGRVEVSVRVSEPLLTTPFLSLAPSGGVPILVPLGARDALHYAGAFEITDTTPSGTAWAVFSARDPAGNRGTEIASGGEIVFDTDGPAIIQLLLTPSAPIQNEVDSPATLNVELALDQPVQAGTEPQLGYWLSGLSSTERHELAIDDLVQIDAMRYRGRFTLPADAGLDEVETLRFVFAARDDLDNLGTGIEAANGFQVYQGDLPPLEVPRDLRAQARPGGQIALDWAPVAGAVAYQLYRQGPDEDALVAHRRVTATSLTDTPGPDGAYAYALASVRAANGQEAISAPSPTVTVDADATAPAPPEGLALALVGAGIQATWQPPAGGGAGLTYRIYRAGGTQLTDVSGLTPLQDRIGPNDQGRLGFLDTRPDPNASIYAVTAVDAAGNESPPSASLYLNVGLLPVAGLTVTLTQGGLPRLGWQPGAQDIAGYHVYLDEATATRLNDALLTTPGYTDTGYTGQARRYTVNAVDVNGVASLGRSVLLPAIRAERDAQDRIQRGILNRLDYRVTNAGAEALSGLTLDVEIGPHAHTSAAFALAPGETKTVQVIVGGHADLPDLAILMTRLTYAPVTGEVVTIEASETLEVAEGSLLLDVHTQGLTRGTASRVRLVLENTSAVETEIVTARNAGQAASDELRVLLKDLDGNVLASAPLQQAVGAQLVTLPSGRTVARLAAGEAFTAAWLDLVVPASAPDAVVLEAVVDRLHYHLGQADATTLPGLAARRTVDLIDTAYRAEVDSVAPSVSFGDQDILISGRAIEQATGQPAATVPVTLIISANGFERRVEVLTDAAGRYTHRFTPLAEEAGVFKVSAVHPDLVARPEQAQFTISRVWVAPTQTTLRIPRGLGQTGHFRVGTAPGTRASRVRLEYRPEDQPDGGLPAGIAVTLPAPMDLAPNASADLAVTVRADDTAPESGRLVLVLRSEERGTTPLGKVTVDYRFAAAEPVLRYRPSYLEAGVVHDGAVMETLTLENVGLAPLENVRLTLLTPSGTAPPGWFYLASAEQQGAIAPGETRPVQLVVAPDATVTEGIHQYTLRISADNHSLTEIGLYVTVTTSAIGQALLQLTDIYTATLDANGQPIPGLANARVHLVNETIPSLEWTLTTDGFGEALFTDLPAGTYRFHASAANHQDATGIIEVEPGITVAHSVFLDYQLVSVEWSVREITVEDLYEITLRATYETDVPAAVVVASPSSIRLPDMAVGDVFYGEFTLTNHGLVRAEHIDVTLPENDQYLRYELAEGLPDTLEAKAQITVPYRAVLVQPFLPDGSASGGGCVNYIACATASYDYVCANGTRITAQSRYCITHTVPGCGPTSRSSTGTAWTTEIIGGFDAWDGYGSTRDRSMPLAEGAEPHLVACRPSGSNRRCNATGNGPGHGR